MQFMTLIDAIEIVLELARQNIAPDDMPDERDRQLCAIGTLEDFAVNHLGEE